MYEYFQIEIERFKMNKMSTDKICTQRVDFTKVINSYKRHIGINDKTEIMLGVLLCHQFDMVKMDNMLYVKCSSCFEKVFLDERIVMLVKAGEENIAKYVKERHPKDNNSTCTAYNAGVYASLRMTCSDGKTANKIFYNMSSTLGRSLSMRDNGYSSDNTELFFDSSRNCLACNLCDDVCSGKDKGKIPFFLDQHRTECKPKPVNNTECLAKGRDKKTQGGFHALTDTTQITAGSNHQQSNLAVITEDLNNLKFENRPELSNIIRPNKVKREQKKCVICCDEVVDSLFLECKHSICCFSCARTTIKCPECRTNTKGNVEKT